MKFRLASVSHTLAAKHATRMGHPHSWLGKSLKKDGPPAQGNKKGICVDFCETIRRMNPRFVYFLLLLVFVGCKVQPSTPTPMAIDDAEKGSTAYLQSLGPENRKSYDDLKADWINKQKGGSADFEKTYFPRAVLQSQTILGELGYGTLFTGIVDDRTRDALLLYQKKNGIFQSGNVDPLTWFSLGEDEKVLNDRLTLTSSFFFFAKRWNEYFSANGAWDYKNKDEGTIDSSTIECDKSSGTCKEADGIEMTLFGMSSVQVSTTDFRIIKWNDFEIVAEDTALNCEKDQIVIVRDERTVTMHMISTNPGNEDCRKLMGDTSTIDAHLKGEEEIGKARREAIQKKRASLLQFSDTAKQIIQAGK
jgi:hypothetical protein